MKRVDLLRHILKNKCILLTLGLIIVGGSVFLFFNRPLEVESKTRFVKIGDTSIEVEIVDTPRARTKGLSGRKTLPDGTGMLFVFDQGGEYGFWMKEMNFAIDIVWIDGGFEVVGVTEMVTPETYPKIFYPPEPVKYVLELPGGKFRNSSIDIGALMYFE